MTTTTANLDRILAKIQKLVALADHANTPPAEAESARLRAEALMLEYRIEEWQVSQQADASAGIIPVWRRMRVCQTSSEYRTTYRSLISYCLHHVDAKASLTYETDENGVHWTIAEAVGYDSDLRYAELLFTAFSLAFGGKMEPKVNPLASDAENAYVLRSAGKTGREIAMLLWQRDDKAAKSKARRLFAQHAESLGEDPAPLLGRTGASIAVFRENYAEGFQDEAWSRLNRMKMSTGETGALVLKSRKEAVLEMWYERHPHLRPDPNRQAQTASVSQDACERCKRAKSGYCREHAWMRPTVQASRPFHAAGYDRGRIAAQSVDLGGRGTRVSTTDRKEIG